MKSLIKLLGLVGLTLHLNAQTHFNIETWLDSSQLFGGSVSVTYGSTQRTVLAGQIRALSSVTSWVGYCTDMNNVLQAGHFNPVPLDLAVNPFHQNPDWVPGGVQRASTAVALFSALVDSPAEAVGLQLAVWELLYDPSPSLVSGILRAQEVTPGSLFVASSIISDQRVLSPSASSGAVWWMPTTANGQYRVAQGLISDIPETSTICSGLALIAVTFLAFSRKI
jgi:hypothetical protein